MSIAIDTFSYFDRVAVINLRRRADRLAEFQQQVRAIDWPFRPIEVVRAFDGGSGVIPCPRTFTQGGGAWGCSLSHAYLVGQALMDGVERLLVFEDDAAFLPGFAELVRELLVRVPADWQMIHLGGQNMKPPTPLEGVDGIVRSVEVGRTHAYALQGKEIMQAWFLWCAQASVHIDWYTDRFLKRFKCYAPAPFIVAQRGQTMSDINGRENRGTFWSDPARDSLVVWFRSTPQQTIDELRKVGFHFGYEVDRRGRDLGLVRTFERKRARDQRVAGVAKYLGFVIGEAAAASRPSVAALWHPDADNEDQVIYDAAAKYQLVELSNPSVEQAIDAWHNASRQKGGDDADEH